MRICGTFGTILIVSLFVVPALSAQIVTLEEIPERPEYGHIPDSLFLYEPDHDYPYEFLSRHIRVEFESTGEDVGVRLVYLNRIRIYEDDPAALAEAAFVTIPYHSAQGVEQVQQLEAATHHSAEESTPLDLNDVRYSDLNHRYRLIEFLMPDVRPGAILEYRYEIRRSYLDELPDLQLSERVPVKSIHMELHNEDFIRYRAVGAWLNTKVGYHQEWIDRFEEPLLFTQPQPEPLLIEHWFASDLPSAGNEPYAPPLPDRNGRIKFQISEFGTPRQPLVNSWEYIAAQIRRSELSPFREMDRLGGLRQLGADLARDSGSDRQLIRDLFSYVNERMEFNGEKSPFPDGNVQDVLQGEPADQATVNLALLVLLKGAGLEAWPVYVPGREAGRIERSFPSLFQFNQLLVVAEAEGERIWLDASYPASHPGLIPPEAWSEEGWMLTPDRYEWVDVDPKESMYDLTIHLNGEFGVNGDLSGSIEVVASGYSAREIREVRHREEHGRELFRTLFFDSYPEADLYEVVIEEEEHRSDPITIQTGFRIPGYALTFREGLQFHPVVMGYLEENPFPEQDRTWQVQLEAPERVDVRYDLRLPEGFEMAEDPLSGRTGLDGAFFTEQYEATGRRLSYRFLIEIERRTFDLHEYSALRDLYERWVLLSSDEWFIETEEE